MDEHQAVLQAAPGLRRHLIRAENPVGRQQAPPADPVLRVAFLRQGARDQLDARPNAARILPPAARPGEPLAQDRPGRDEPALGLVELPGQRSRLPGRAHAARDQARQEAGRDREPRAFRDAVHVADQFESPSRSGKLRQQVGQALLRPFHAGRNQAGRDQRRLEQAKVIPREVEHLGQAGDLGPSAQVDAGEAQHGFVDHPQVRLHGRAGRAVAAADAEIDRDVEDASAFGEIHAEEEDVAPRAVRQVHAHGRRLAQDRVGRVGRGPVEQLGPQPQRLVGRVAEPEHPLVAPHRSDAAPHLVRQGLERQPVVRGRERARHGLVRSLGSLLAQKDVDRLFEAPRQQVGVAVKRDESPLRNPALLRQVKAMDVVQEEQRPDPLVQVAARPAERIEVRRTAPGAPPHPRRAPRHPPTRCALRVGRR